MIHLFRVCAGFGKVWKAMEIDDAIFQDLKSFGRGRFFKMAMEKLWIFVWKNCKHFLKMEVA